MRDIRHGDEVGAGASGMKWYIHVRPAYENW